MFASQKLLFSLLVSSSLILGFQDVKAEEKDDPTKEKEVVVSEDDIEKIAHKLNIEGSLAITTGNSDSDNFRGDIDLVSTLRDWTNKLDIEASNKKQNNIREEEYYKIGDKLQKEISDMQFVFAEIIYEDDRFSGIDYRMSETIGVGHYFIKTDDLKISGDVGIGARQTNYIGNTPDEETFLGKAGLDIFWKVNENVEFTEEADISAGEDNTEFESETAVKAFINKNLYLKFSYEIRHNTDVPVSKKNTDTETIFTVGYQFD